MTRVIHKIFQRCNMIIVMWYRIPWSQYKLCWCHFDKTKLHLLFGTFFGKYTLQSPYFLLLQFPNNSFSSVINVNHSVQCTHKITNSHKFMNFSFNLAAQNTLLFLQNTIQRLLGFRISNTQATWRTATNGIETTLIVFVYQRFS